MMMATLLILGGMLMILWADGAPLPPVAIETIVGTSRALRAAYRRTATEPVPAELTELADEAKAAIARGQHLRLVP